MNKEWFNEKVSNIELPEKELLLAIEKGIEKGRNRKKFKRNTKWIASLSTIAASLVLASGFIFTPVGQVMANVPIIGSIYESVQAEMGMQLETKNLITELNETASDNGVNVTITSAYYDGIYIGFTFKVDGLDLSEEDLEKMQHEGDYDVGYDFYLYEIDGVKDRWGGGDYYLQKVDNYYIGAAEVEYPEKDLPKNYTLPITFERVGNIEGKWQFKVPVTQLPLKKYEIVNNTTKDQNYSFTLESLTIGETIISWD